MHLKTKYKPSQKVSNTTNTYVSKDNLSAVDAKKRAQQRQPNLNTLYEVSTKLIRNLVKRNGMFNELMSLSIYNLYMYFIYWFINPHLYIK